LIRKRGLIKARLTRFKTYLEASTSVQEILQLKLRLSIAEDCQNFTHTQIKSAGDCAVQVNEHEGFESSYFRLISAAQVAIERDSVSNTIHLHKNITQYQGLNSQF
jgi:hypothetical protein